MELSRKIDLLTKTVATEQRAMRAQKILATGVLCAGLIAAALIQILSGPTLAENHKWILSLSATFISTGAGFPLKDIYAKRNRIAMLVFLREEYEAWQSNPAGFDPKQVEELEKRFWEFFNKSL